MKVGSAEDRHQELRTLRNKILADPGQDWRRERARIAELERLTAADAEARAPA